MGKQTRCEKERNQSGGERERIDTTTDIINAFLFSFILIEATFTLSENILVNVKPKYSLLQGQTTVSSVFVFVYSGAATNDYFHDPVIFQFFFQLVN